MYLKGYKVMRTNARETAFKILFAAQFNDEIEETKRLVSAAEKLNENDISYLNSVILSVNGHKAELTKMIDERSHQFPESRLFPADRSILLIALAEILYFDDIPSAVSVNEAANIASKYSSEKSANFISGILAEIIKEHGNV